MAAMKCRMVTQWATIPLLLLLCFGSLLNKRLGGPGNMKNRVIRHYSNVLI